MSKIVSKGSGKTAAAARTAKHAQRTPLPPRPGDVRAAMAPVAPEYGKMTQAQLLKVALGLGLEPPKSAPKGKLLNAILAATRAASIRSEIAGERIPQTVAETVKAVQTFTPGALTKSEAKAAPIAELAAKLGWTSSTATDGDATTLTVTRADETISILWISGVFKYPCTYTVGGRTVGVRNASEAKQRMEKSPDMAQAEAVKVRVSRVGVAKGSIGRTPKALPFSGVSTDAEVLAAVEGRKITWVNSVSNQAESDSVPNGERVNNRTNRPKITEGPAGRVLTFTGPSGFRSVRLSSITSVR